MKKDTKSHPKKLDVVDRWTAAASGVVQARRLGKPKGELNPLICMAAEWSKIPNMLLEDATGQLWLAFAGGDLDNEIYKESGFEAVSVEEALEWLQAVSEFCDGHDGDVADVCRIALGELRRRPNYVDAVAKVWAAERRDFPKRPKR